MARNGKRQALALALAEGASVKDAAAACGVGTRTAYRWCAEDPDFRRLVEALRQELFAQACGRLCKSAALAADTLGKLLGARNQKVRLAAAKAVLQAAPKLREATDLSRRLDELEERLKKRESKR